MEVTIVGDVHGQTAALSRLLSKVPQRGPIVFVGDLVDRGDSIGALRMVMRLAERRRVITVRGNHEHAAIRRRLRGKPRDGWEREADQGMWRFLEAMPLTWSHGRLRVVHAGIGPRLAALGSAWLDSQPSSRSEERRRERVLYTRFVDRKTGAFLALGKEKPGDPFWSEVYDGSCGFVAYGHQIWPEPRRDQFALGIDTGAYQTGRLSAAVLDTAEPERAEIISVTV